MLKNLEKIFGIIIFVGFAFIILIFLSNFKELKATSKYDIHYQVYTDQLGCTWFIVNTGRTDGGVHTVHHPTCSNSTLYHKK